MIKAEIIRITNDSEIQSKLLKVIVSAETDGEPDCYHLEFRLHGSAAQLNGDVAIINWPKLLLKKMKNN